MHPLHQIFCSCSEQKKGKPPNKSPPVNNNNWLAEQATLAQLNEVSSYVDNLCEVCRKLNPDDSNYVVLKSAFKSEATKFMKKFHDERLKKIDMILENETWKQTQVPVEFQFLVNQISAEGKFLEHFSRDRRKADEMRKTCETRHVCMDNFMLFMLLHETDFSCLTSQTVTWYKWLLCTRQN